MCGVVCLENEEVVRMSRRLGMSKVRCKLDVATAPGKPSMMHATPAASQPAKLSVTDHHHHQSSYLSALRCECQSLVPSFFASTCGPMVTPRRLSKYNPRNFNFNFDSLSSTTTDVRQRLARLNNRSLSQSRRFSEACSLLVWAPSSVAVFTTTRSMSSEYI